MDRRSDPGHRDRAMGRVRRGTVGAVGTALGLSGVFSAAAAVSFAGNQTSAPPVSPPFVPVEAAPAQAPPPTPPVVIRIVHHPATLAGGGAAPRPPAQAPAPAGRAPSVAPPPPPPPPLCHSTPSHPC